jgi:hypothetical protein
MELNFRWVDQKGKYLIKKNLLINRICIGNCVWNSFASRTSDISKRYVGEIYLPSVKIRNYYGETVEEVMSQIEKAAKAWFAHVLNEGK